MSRLNVPVLGLPINHKAGAEAHSIAHRRHRRATGGLLQSPSLHPMRELQAKKNPLKIQWVSCMAHSGGFEPPTARFVAEYSIQLSYECVVGAYYRASYLPVNLFFLFNSRNYLLTTLQYKSGGEGGIRTLDTLLRCTPLAGERLRPLGHLSVTRAEY